jgi:tetratricopeptide (TPR) repeat protein
VNIKSFILFLTIFSFSLLFSTKSNGQNVYKQNNVDSAAIQKRVQQEYIARDSIMNALKQKKINDSIARVMEKIKIQQYRDSLVKARNDKRIKDSTDRALAKQKLLDERRIKDSLELVKKRALKDSLDNVAAAQERLRKEEMRIRDSINLVRIKTQDSIAFARKREADSLKAIRIKQQQERDAYNKYVNSDKYKDSVATRKKQIMDSTNAIRLAVMQKQKEARDQYNDSVKLARQRYNDSVVTERTRINDSIRLTMQQQNQLLKEERTRIKDSLVAAREKRADSLELVRKEKEKKDGSTKKLTDEKKKLALAIKMHDAKQKEWSNEKLLKRKWNLPRKIYQNTVTRYNYHYNAKRKYDEAIQRITKNNKEDFTKPIALLPYNTEKDGTSIASDMDTVIKKASFSTQIHDPRSKWFDNLYFLMGKASYAKNDYDGAITTFQFIANEYKDTRKGQNNKTKKGELLSIATIENRKGIRKLRHHPIRNDALIWLAKSYIMAEQFSEAQSLLGTLQKDPNFPARKKAELFLTKANLDINQGNTNDAIESLELALKQSLPNKQRTRTEFILGQLYAEKKDYAKSSEHYKKSIDGKNNPEMDFYTKLNIAVNASKGGGDKEFAKDALKKIIADAKFEKYKSEALNTLAAIEAEDNIALAADLLKKSIKNPENKDMKQKAIAFASLGSIYYKLSEYELAKTSYDSAAVYGSNPPIDNLDEVNIRKTVLGEIVTYIRTIKSQDSMINLSRMSEKEQKAAAKRELDKLKKQQENQPAPNELQVVALQPMGAVKSNWYFYNNNLIQKGSTDFKQKWGNRKLEDNWRRSGATNNFNLNAGAEENEEGEDGETDNNGNGASIKSLLALLPKSPAQIDAAHLKIQDAYYNLGLAYFSQLSDYMNAVKTFDTLLAKYPKTTYKQQTYYALYLNYDKLNQKVAAQKYKNLLMEEFGQSEFALMANNPNYKEQTKNKSKNIFDHYDQTYQTYKEGKYKEAIDRVTYAKAAYKEHPIQAKYALVEAVSEAGLHDLPKCKTILEDIISKYPNSDEQIRAQEILNLMKTQNANDSGIVKDIIVPNMNKYDDSLEASKTFKELRDNDGKGNFVTAPDEEHFVLIFLKNVDGRSMALKAAMSDYNLLKNNMQEYTTALNLLTAQQGILTIQKFTNAFFAKKYLIELNKETLIFSQLKKYEYDTAIITVVNYGELLKSRDILGYMKFYKKNYK